MDIIFPKEVKKYVELQCNGKYELYRDMPEIKYIDEYIKDLNPKKCLDIGSGIGRASVYFFKRYNWINTQFVLADGDGGDKQFNGIRKDKNEFYNSFNAMITFLDVNGLDKVSIVNAKNNCFPNTVIDIDFAYSFLAIGFHWPLEFYLSSIYKVLKNHGLVIFGMRGMEKHEWVLEQVDMINRSMFKVIRLKIVKKLLMQSVLILEKI